MKLLVSLDQIGCLSDNKGNVISKIRDVSGADVHILGGAPENQVVKVKGYLFFLCWLLSYIKIQPSIFRHGY